MAGRFESPVCPGFPAVGRLIDAEAPQREPARGRVSRPDPDDLGIRGSQGEVSDGDIALFGKKRGEGCAVVFRLPEASRGRRDIERERPFGKSLDMKDAAALAGRADGSPGKGLENRVGTLRIGCGAGRPRYGKRQKNRRAQETENIVDGSAFLHRLPPAVFRPQSFLSSAFLNSLLMSLFPRSR